MNTKRDDSTWFFVVVQDPGGNEQFFGLYDETSDVSYIPTFENKDAAQNCLLHLPTQKGKKYEIQAVLFGDLKKDAFGNGFLIFILDEAGKIIEKIFPAQTSGHVH